MRDASLSPLVSPTNLNLSIGPLSCCRVVLCCVVLLCCVVGVVSQRSSERMAQEGERRLDKPRDLIGITAEEAGRLHKLCMDGITYERFCPCGAYQSRAVWCIFLRREHRRCHAWISLQTAPSLPQSLSSLSGSYVLDTFVSLNLIPFPRAPFSGNSCCVNFREPNHEGGRISRGCFFSHKLGALQHSLCVSMSIHCACL